MDRYDKIEQLVLKLGVSYEDARNALNACDWDLVKAADYLKHAGKTAAESDFTEEKNIKSEKFNSALENAGTLLERSGKILFEVQKDGKHILSVPVLALVICALFMFWVVVPLLICGLFFGFRYSIHGASDKADSKINDVLGQASDAAGKAAENAKEKWGQKDE
ncbi:MAG: hypothetical protein IJK56_05370 [Firmicutes bacterium]|nr:hypothetical protein [Bacillota bacterium]